MKQCNHDNLKYFKEKDIVMCIDCADKWYRSQNKKFVDRNDKIINMINNGHTFQAVGDKFDLTRQRIHSIYNSIK